ncbi:hypothetical protein C8R44DRAFT_736633 [Mycena epipterygia]|nr:hypothetical protein C8R44DRAFT_736633 [Mycena epipterygia]
MPLADDAAVLGSDSNDEPGEDQNQARDVPEVNGDEDDDNDNKPENEDDQSSKSSSVKKVKVKRIRVSKNNPKHGYVAGVMKGVEKMGKFFRLRPGPLPELHDDPTRRFNILMEEILARCEHLGAETGCWLILGAAHKGAGGSQEIHFTTQALRADAPEATTDILNQFRILIAGMKKARRSTAVGMGMALVEAEAAKIVAEQKAL